MADEYKPKIIESFSPTFADYEIGEYSHLYKVETFNRIEDSETGVHTTVEGDLVSQDRDMRRNPSGRRSGVALHFYSEVNDAPWDKFVMCIFQHKGNEYIKFMSEPEYILTSGGNRAI